MLTPASVPPLSTALLAPEPALALEPASPPQVPPPPAAGQPPPAAAPRTAPHQINLVDSVAPRQIEWLGSSVALLALASALGVSALITLVLTRVADQADARAATTEQTLAALRLDATDAASSAPSAAAAELTRLRATAASQRRVRAALDPGLTRDGPGYSEYLQALSRQGTATLWLTRFSVAAEGRTLEIGGRMTDPRQLPEYLRRLDVEPLFHGRNFAQLNLKAVEPGTQTGDGAEVTAGYVEFMLRSTATASETR